jgi:hypothetical protein
LLAGVLSLLVLNVPFAHGDISTAPTIDSSTPASPANNNDPTLNGSADATAVLVSIYTDSSCSATVVATGAVSGGSFSVQVHAADNTTTTFYAAASDALSNVSACSSGFTYVEDSTPPPTPSIDTKPTNPSGSGSATFTFSSSGASSYSCQLDDGGFADCSSGSKSYSALGDGSHTFEVVAADALGNQSGAAVYAWAVDTKAPPPPKIETAPANPSGSSGGSFTFSDTEEAAFRCQLDGGAFSDCSSGSFTYSGLADGSHTFGVKAVDKAGNESAVTSYTWTIDTTQPIVTFTDKPPLITNQKTASFSFAADPGSTYECSLDGAAFAACTSPQLYPLLPDGTHTFAVQATHLGNTGPPAEYTWTIDSVAPDTAVSTGPPNPSNSAAATFTFRSSEPGSTFWCSLDATGFTPCTTPYTYSGLGNGSHTFRVRAIDSAGNSDSTPATYSWQIVNVGPPIADRTPPGKVRRLVRNVSYSLLELQWRNPRDGDFDHVSVFVSTSAKTAATTVLWTGRKTRYRDHRFKNGLYYRYAVVTYDHSNNASRPVQRVVSPGILLISPRNGQRVKKPPRLRWNEVRRASFYNVQLYYGKQKVLSAWPSGEKLALHRNWTYAGRSFRLRRGTYHWYVWPAFGPRSASRYGQLLGQSSFRIR